MFFPIAFQRALWDLGAVPMLQSLTNSKHSTISTCSTGALKNLFSARPLQMGSSPEDVGGHPSLQVSTFQQIWQISTIIDFKFFIFKPDLSIL